MTDEPENNVFRMLSGGKAEAPAEDTIPQNEYVITDKNGNEHYASGFLLFTSQHVAVMREAGNGALPVLVMPLDVVFSAELVEDDDDEVIDDELPF